MEFRLTFLTLEDYYKIFLIMEEKNLSKSDAIELYCKENPGKLKDFGVLQDDGKVRQTKISTEGVETKEVDLWDVIEDLTSDQ
jgi:hypothetical protein